MSDSTFNYVFVFLVFMAVCFNAFIVYKIAQRKNVYTRHIVILRPEQKSSPQACFCSIDEDGWKEIKAETL